ncbi:hypothetical protein GGI20_001832 [Coemansia sp. BCRC 34301]|nr:hypothetical protein GGI20_001832 [Coemansia sp. BCRC 34301]
MTTTATATSNVVQLLEALRPSAKKMRIPATLLSQLPETVTKKLCDSAELFEPCIDPEAPEPTKEDVSYMYFHNLVLFVIQCLKALPATSTPRDSCRLLLPYKGPRDFKPLDSTETFKLDQALFIRQWEYDIGDGISESCITDMLAVMEAKQAESDLVVNRASGMASAGSGGRLSRKASSTDTLASYSSVGLCKRPILEEAQEQLVRYNCQLYEHQHNRMFTWGLTVCESLLQVYLFGPDCILSSGSLNMRAPVGRKFIEWLANMCLGEDVRRGFMSSMRLVDDTANGCGEYWEILVPAADNDGTAKS